MAPMQPNGGAFARVSSSPTVERMTSFVLHSTREVCSDAAIFRSAVPVVGNSVWVLFDGLAVDQRCLQVKSFSFIFQLVLRSYFFVLRDCRHSSPIINPNQFSCI